MTLQEIFKDDLELLENDSVKKLIEHVKKTHKKSFELVNSFSDRETRMLSLFMHSEVILIGGKSSRETLESIGKILGE